MNKLLNDIIESRGGHYCHALEVSSTYELEEIVYNLISEFIEEYSREDIEHFFNSISIYYYNEDDTLSEYDREAAEEELYNFDLSQCVIDAIDYMTYD